jgi:hypothetical protein
MSLCGGTEPARPREFVRLIYIKVRPRDYAHTV